MLGCSSTGLCAVVGHSLDGYAIVVALACASLLCITLALLCYLSHAEAAGRCLNGFGLHWAAVSLLWLMATLLGALGMLALMPTADATGRHSKSVAIASCSAVQLLVEFALLDALRMSNASRHSSPSQYCATAAAALCALIAATAILCFSAFMRMGVQDEVSGQSIAGSVQDCLCIFDVDE